MLLERESSTQLWSEEEREDIIECEIWKVVDSPGWDYIVHDMHVVLIPLIPN